MSWPITLTILSIASALFVWAARIDRRPVDLMRPRLIPTLPIMAVSAVVILMMLAHVITLVTGQPFAGRIGP